MDYEWTSSDDSHQVDYEWTSSDDSHQVDYEWTSSDDSHQVGMMVRLQVMNTLTLKVVMSVHSQQLPLTALTIAQLLCVCACVCMCVCVRACRAIWVE